MTSSNKCKCILCGRKYTYKRSGMTKTKCNSCLVNTRRFKLREKIVGYLGGKCVRCGYNKCNRALHFHHLNPKSKSFNISGAHSRSWKAIETELQKGILICANCHAETHDSLQA